MVVLVLCVGFALGALTLVALEVLGVFYFISRLNKRVKAQEAKSNLLSSTNQQLDISYPNKQGAVWILESEKIPKTALVEKTSREQKRKNVLEVQPVRKDAKIKNQSLVLGDPDGSETEICLKGCVIRAVSATDLPSRKWAKKYPIKVESRTSTVYNGSNTLYIYLETSWEKESWCKALRLVSCDDKDKLKWFNELNSDFHSYLSLLNTGYTSFLKPSAGFNAEPIDKSIKVDGSSSKVRNFLKKLAKRASKSGPEYKFTWNIPSSHEEGKFSERSRSLQESFLPSGTVRTATSGKAPNFSAKDNTDRSSIPYSSSRNNFSPVTEADSDDKTMSDEGTICLNMLILRLFFDAKNNIHMKSSLQARFQRMLSNMRIPSYIGEVICTAVDLGNLPPYIHCMRVLPSDMNELWAFEIDIDYSGNVVLDIETRLEVRELELQGGMVDTNLGSSSVEEVPSDLLEDFEYFGQQLNLSDQKIDEVEHQVGDHKLNGLKSSRSTTQASSNVSRWKSLLNSIAKQVSQVPLALGIRVASLRGTMRLHLKPPPSDQIWFGFTSMPDIDFQLESFVGERKITSGHIALYLISRFKAAIQDTLVLPNCESFYIPWMLSEKDDWLPRKVAPFFWIRQEAVGDPTHEVPGSHSSDASCTADATRGITAVHPEVKQEKADKMDFTQQSVDKSMEAHASTLPPTDMSTSSDKQFEDLRTPLLRNNEPQHNCMGSKDDRLQSQSPSRVLVPTEEQNIVVEGDDTKSKKMGTRTRMLGWGKKMGEKFDERRRHIEEKGRHIVEKMRGPQD